MKRRQFIENLSITAMASLLLNQNVLANKSVKKVRVALVGLGYYSTDVLAPALQETKNIELVGIVTGTPEKAKAWKEKYNLADKNIYNYQNFDTIASNLDIDVVYVVLPPSMHKEYVIRAAKAGKHVFCEKPMAPTVADCQAMIKACKKANVKLAIGYRCQHDPNIQAYQAFAKNKKLGEVVEIISKAGYVEGRKGIWKTKKAMGGGVLADMGVYAIQAARMATGTEPIAVLEAKTSIERPEYFQEVEETVQFKLQFPNNAIAHCYTSFGKNINELEIKYQNGWVKMEPHTGYGGNKGIVSDGTKINFNVPNQQILQMDNDALSVVNNTNMLCPGQEGLQDIKIVQAIYKSAKLGKKVKI